MSISRLVRVNELLKREIAEDIHRIFAMSNFDTAALMVVRVDCAPNLRDAAVFVSIFGHEEERDRMISFLNRHRQEITKKMCQRVKLKYTPRLHFKLDGSVEGGDNILAILTDMERENPAAFRDDEEEQNDELEQ
ncbi:MAG: 30S ribosome-binding factor RbfA [Kiritimatiellales bacterium]|nr:30S ribosome-binding factor RbfA [Kiritimatiellales bacterium]